MKTVYINIKSQYGIETVDEFTREQGQNPKDFRKHVNKMVREYNLAGMGVYKSSRCTKEWKNR